MKKINVIFFALALLLAAPSLQAQIDPKQERYDRLKQMEQASDRSINFYGIVKDQFGQPVAGAKVTGGIEYFSLTAFYFVGIKDIICSSDSNGFFTIQETGKRLSMRNIEKDGYLFKSMDNPKQSFDYSNIKDTNFFTPDANNPVIFILHKKPDPGFVIEKSYEKIEKKSAGGVYRVNLPNGIFNFNDKFNSKQTTHFVFSIKPGINQGEFKLEVKASDNESGFVDQDGEPHLAPEIGYNSLFTLPLKSGDEISKNIYFKWKKSPTQNVYARLKLNLEIAQENIYVTAYLYTNLAGDRNLEYDSAYTEQQLKK